MNIFFHWHHCLVATVIHTILKIGPQLDIMDNSMQSQVCIKCIVNSRIGNKIQVVLGRVNQSYAKDYTKGFEIYLHEKNQFWPGLEMRRTGQTDPIFIPTKREMWGTFKVVHKSKHPRQSAPCVEDPDYSFTHCMMEYVANTAGCHLDWVNPGPFNSIIMAVRYML